METQTVPPSKLKRFCRRAFFALAALITLVALFYAEEDWRGARAWENYKRELAAAGQNYDLGRYIPPKVPDDQNFAATPYFAPFFNLSPEVLRWPVKPEVQEVNGMRVTNEMGLEIANTNIHLGLYDPYPTNLPPRPLAWQYGLASELIYYAQACQSNQSGEAPAPIESPSQAASIILDHLRPCEPTFAELRAASKRPSSRFNLNYTEINNPHVMWALMDGLAATKSLLQIGVLRARAEMVLGQTDAAMADLAVLFRVDDGVKDEPLLIAQLLRMADSTILLQAVGEGLAERRWSDAQLQELQRRLQRTDLLASTARAYSGELDLFVNAGFDRPNGDLYPSALPSGWNRFEQININRAELQVIFPRIDPSAHLVSPSTNRACDLAAHELMQQGWFKLFFGHRLLAAMLLPALAKTPQKAAVAQCKVDQILTACALERFHLAEGRYPEKLDELVPRFADKLPHDVINGQPMKYRRTDDDRFILYSVGWNEKDDGGVVARRPGITGGQDVTQGDCVMEYPK